MQTHGGKRPGAGRKPSARRTRILTMAARAGCSEPTMRRAIYTAAVLGASRARRMVCSDGVSGARAYRIAQLVACEVGQPWG